MDLNCRLEPHQKVIRNFHIVYNGIIDLYFPDAKFYLLGICRSQLYPKETTTFFFWFRTQSGPFFGFSKSNNSSRQRQIELKFSPQVVLIIVQISFKIFWKIRIFTETECSQNLIFWCNFHPNLTPEDGRNQTK